MVKKTDLLDAFNKDYELIKDNYLFNRVSLIRENINNVESLAKILNDVYTDGFCDGKNKVENEK